MPAGWISFVSHWLTAAEPCVNVIALAALLWSGLGRRFPAMRFYMILRCFTDAFLFFILIENRFFPVSIQTQTHTYIYSYWILFAVTAVAIFFVLQEVLKTVMEPAPGLQRLGLTAFRWAGIVVLLVIFGMAPFTLHTHAAATSSYYASAVGVLMLRCMAIAEICMLAFLALSIHSLGRSFRSVTFGICLGFGLEASGELISALMEATKVNSMWDIGSILMVGGSIVTLFIWTTYFLLPEPAIERNPITLPVTSPLVRWNEIASAFGQRPAHVALGTASSSFFLQDIEQTVDKLLPKSH